MKRRITLAATVALITMSGSSFAQSSQEALEYMNSISEAIDEMKGETWSYLKAATKGRSARTMDRKRRNLIEELGNVIAEVRQIGPYHGDDTYISKVQDYLNLTSIVMREDFAEIMNMEEIAEQSYDNMEAYLLAKDIANAKVDSAFEIYHDAHEAFAAANNITLVEAELSSRDLKMRAAGNALKYYNRLFLLQFKSSIQENYVTDAMNRNDLAGVEQSINALKSTAEEGLLALDTVSKYEGDPGLILALRRVLNFYIQEADNELAKSVDFLVMKENFERLAANIQSKSQRDLTKEEIDEYNEAVEEYNSMVPEFNENNETLQEKREEMNEVWNDAVEEFFDEHA